MHSNFTAILKQQGPWWIGWIEEVPGVNAQEETKEKLLVSLKEILTEALEFNHEVEHTNKPIEISKQGKVRFRIIPVQMPDKSPWMRLRSQGILRGENTAEFYRVPALAVEVW